MKQRRAALAIVSLLLASSARNASAEPPAKAPDVVDPHEPFPPPSPRVLEQPDRSYSYQGPLQFPSLAWFALQGLPSPEVAVGRVHEADATGVITAQTKSAFGLRWQLTPVVWSWGTNRRISRWRFLVVDPLARHSGSLELSTGIEYFFGNVDRAIVRPGVRAYFPLVGRGEYLSTSIGTSTYIYDDKARVAYDVGAYVLFGLFGVQATFAPENGPLSAIGTFRIRYF